MAKSYKRFTNKVRYKVGTRLYATKTGARNAAKKKGLKTYTEITERKSR